MDVDQVERNVDMSGDEDEEMGVVGMPEAAKHEAAVVQPVKPAAQKTTLRDLFAPREEEGLSLLVFYFHPW